MPDLTALIVLGLVLVLPLIWAVVVYNRLIALRNHIRESTADIDVELKRRFDLIPNLVATVRGYAAHERDLLERVIALRAAAHRQREEDSDERQLCAGVKQILALAEQYPALKADAHFLALQRELVITEDRLAAARRFFNANVRDYRNACEQFPTSLIARLGSFPPIDWLVTPERERQVPGVTGDARES